MMKVARSQLIAIIVGLATVLLLIAVIVPVTKRRSSSSSSSSTSTGLQQSIPTFQPTGVSPSITAPAPPPIAPAVSTPVAPILAPTPAPVVVATPIALPAAASVRLYLIDAQTNSQLVEVTDGATIDLATVGSTTTSWNVQAVKVDPLVSGVRFTETGRQETTEPFSFCGDNGGNYNSCTELSMGLNTVTVEPFRADGELPPLSVTFTIMDSSIPPGRWIEIDAAAPIDARHEACFVLVDTPGVGRRGYLVGGRGDSDKALDIFDPVTRTWTTGTPAPAQLHHMQCVQAQGKLWIVAAWTDWFPRETNPEVIYIYDPATDTWSTGTALPEDRRRGAAAVVVAPDESKIYVSHGNSGGHETGDHAESLPYLDVYDIASDSWTALSDSAPNPRDHTGGAWINGRICVAGGRNGGELNWPEVAPTDCYDVATGTWSVEAPIPNPRGGSSYGTSCDGHLLVAGGEGSGKAWDTVEVFDGSSWSRMGSLNVGRHGSGLVVDCECNTITIASGASSQGGGPEIQSVEMYFADGVESTCSN